MEIEVRGEESYSFLSTSEEGVGLGEDEVGRGEEQE